MLNDLMQQFAPQIQTISFLLFAVNVILHVVFAGAVAKDGGHMLKLGQKTAMVSPYTWAFATLLGGVTIATIYWFIHHSTLTRNTSTTKLTERGM